MSELYEPAHTQHIRVMKGNYDYVREKARWTSKIREVWDRVRFVDPGSGPPGTVISGRPVTVKTAIDLAGLSPDDVRVEIVMGSLDSNGHLEETEVMILPAVERQDPVAVFARDIVPERTGRLGYALRVSPNHFDDPLTRPCTSLLKWSPAG
jgi:starch phosphorylase